VTQGPRDLEKSNRARDHTIAKALKCRHLLHPSSKHHIRFARRPELQEILRSEYLSCSGHDRQISFQTGVMVKSNLEPEYRRRYSRPALMATHSPALAPHQSKYIAYLLYSERPLLHYHHQHSNFYMLQDKVLPRCCGDSRQRMERLSMFPRRWD